MAKDFIKYLATPPSTWREWTYRIVLTVLIILGLLRLERIRRGQLDTQQKVDAVATAVATEVGQ